MTDVDLATAVRQLVELQLGHPGVQLGDRLAQDLHADSFDIMNLAAVLEEEHDVVITEEAAAELDTVADLVALVERLAAG